MAAGTVKLIKTLLIASRVVGFDETTLRSGAAGEKKYVHGAFTEKYSLFHLGTRSLQTMKDFGILPDFAGIAVTDRYGNYFHVTWKNISGHQACVQHILRDLQDCAETYPGAIWPEQAQEALRALIHARNQASGDGLDAIPAAIREPLEKQFRRAITVALADVPRIPGPRNSTKQHPGRDMLEFCRDREADVLRFTTDTGVWPTNNISESGLRPNKTQQKVSGRLPSDDTTQDRLDIRSYIDSTRNTDATSSTCCTPCSPATPGHPRYPARPDPRTALPGTPHTQHITHHPRHMGECLLYLPIDCPMTKSTESAGRLMPPGQDSRSSRITRSRRRADRSPRPGVHAAELSIFGRLAVWSARTSYSQALATFDPAAILASLSDEVTIWVAVHDEPLQGKETASFLFGVLTQGLTFQLTEEIVEGDKSAVLFETSLRGHRAHGLNVVTYQPDGLVGELTVFFRPLAAMQLIADVIGDHMAQQVGTPPPEGMR